VQVVEVVVIVTDVVPMLRVAGVQEQIKDINFLAKLLHDVLNRVVFYH